MAVGKNKLGDRIANGSMASLAVDHALNILTTLMEIRAEAKLVRETLMGKRHYEVVYGGQVESGVSKTFQPTEPIPQGHAFIPEHAAVIAPAGSKLQLFENQATPPNFIEVVANVQEYANFIAGLIVEGPCVLLAVISGATATGACSIRISGQLVKKIPSTDSQI